MRSALRAAVWASAFLVAIAAARYFLDPPPLLRPPPPPFEVHRDEAFRVGNEIAPHLYENHRALFLTHVGCGLIALTLGLWQFSTRLRTRRPAIHRRIGIVYCCAVAISGVTGFPLSFLLLEAAEESFRPVMYGVTAGFATLAVVWTAITATAYVRAQQRRFEEHRAWMMRSYSLTFAAVSVRIVATAVVFLTADVAIAVNAGVLSWPLNLVVAEWLIRSQAREPVVTLAESRA